MANFIIQIGKSHSSKWLAERHRSEFFPESENISTFPLGDHGVLAVYGDDPGDVTFAHSTDKDVLIMDGYLSECGISGKKDPLDASNLMGIFGQYSNNRSLGDLSTGFSGSFSFIYSNFRNGKTFLITDRVGSRPLWYSVNKSMFQVTNNPNLIACINDDVQYNMGALGSFLLYGSPAEPSKSIYKGVSGVRPGRVLSFENFHRSDTYVWYQFQHKPDSSYKKGEWVEMVAGRIKDATNRVLKTTRNPLLFLSGGVDSRLAASAIKSNGINPLLVTLCDGSNLELSVSKKTGKALACQQHVITRDSHWYLRSLTKAVFNSGGSFEWTHAHFSQAYLEMKKLYNNDAAILGDFFEAFSKLCCEVDEQRTEVWTPLDFIHEYDSLPLPSYRPANREATLKLIHPDVRSLMIDELNDDIWKRYTKIQNISDDPKIVADHFFRWHTAPTIATFHMILDLRSAGKERSIMFEKDLHGTLEILPSSIRDQTNFGALLIKNLWPAASRIVNSNTLLPVAWPQSMHAFARKIKPYAGKTRRFLLSNTYKNSGSWPKKSMLYLYDLRWRSAFDSILMDGTLYDEAVFDVDQIKTCWAQFLKGNMSLAPDIEKLVQIGVMSQILNGNKRGNNPFFR